MLTRTHAFACGDSERVIGTANDSEKAIKTAKKIDSTDSIGPVREDTREIKRDPKMKSTTIDEKSRVLLDDKSDVGDTCWLDLYIDYHNGKTPTPTQLMNFVCVCGCVC